MTYRLELFSNWLIAITNDRYRKMKNSAHTLLCIYRFHRRRAVSRARLFLSENVTLARLGARLYRWRNFTLHFGIIKQTNEDIFSVYSRSRFTQGLGMLVHFAGGTFLVTVPEQERALSESSHQLQYWNESTKWGN